MGNISDMESLFVIFYGDQVELYLQVELIGGDIGMCGMG